VSWRGNDLRAMHDAAWGPLVMMVCFVIGVIVMCWLIGAIK
jgi:ABC-type protease/lipase transport system fused ATPase/permease subunit